MFSNQQKNLSKLAIAAAISFPADTFGQQPLPKIERKVTSAVTSSDVEIQAKYPAAALKVEAILVEPVRQDPDIGPYSNFPTAKMFIEVAERQKSFKIFESSCVTLHEDIHHLHAYFDIHYGSRPEFAQPRKYRDKQGNVEIHNVSQPIWLGNQKMAVVKDPEGVVIADILQSVPESLRRARAGEYLTREAPMHPAMYILDEHAAYLHDAEHLVQSHDYIVTEYQKIAAKHKEDPKKYEKEPFEYRDAADGGDGAGEFIAYSLALAKAIESRPGSYANQRDRLQALAVIKLLCERSANVYREAINHARYPLFRTTQRDYLKNLRDKPDAGSLRDFTRRTFGDRWFKELVSE